MGQDYAPAFTNAQAARRFRLFLENDLNRVYSGALGRLAAAELHYVAEARLAERLDIEITTFGRANVLEFESSADVLPILGGPSSSLMVMVDGTPHPLDDNLTYGTELATTQRYKGKTNERLTRAMVTIAAAVAGECNHILDPMCGRGTTLNWALAYGHQATGIEVDRSALDHYDTFITNWARRARLPHRRTAYRKGNAEHRHLTIELAVDRNAQKAGDTQTVQTFVADGGDGTLPIRRGSVDAVVADLPYGVQHHDPDAVELVDRLAPTWTRWLRPGGSVVLAWNTKRAGRDRLAQGLVDSGFTILPEPISMAHQVDATIHRDVLVGRIGSSTP